MLARARTHQDVKPSGRRIREAGAANSANLRKAAVSPMLAAVLSAALK